MQTTLDATKATLAKVEADLARCDQQLATARADADQAYQQQDAALVAKLFTRQQALERQRADYASDRQHALAAVQAAYAPQVAAIAGEATALLAGWQQEQDTLLGSITTALATVAEALAALDRLPTGLERAKQIVEQRRALVDLQEAAAPAVLAVPAIPDAVLPDLATAYQALVRLYDQCLRCDRRVHGLPAAAATLALH